MLLLKPRATLGCGGGKGGPCGPEKLEELISLLIMGGGGAVDVVQPPLGARPEGGMFIMCSVLLGPVLCQ